MTPASTPAPGGPLPVTAELATKVRDFRLRIAVIDRETEIALDLTRNRCGRTVHADVAAAARANRDKAALEASFVVQPRTVDVLEAPGPPRLRPTPHRFPSTTDRRSALPEAPAEPFMTIRHTITGEITTTGYNAAARRILLQAGFDETPGCACRATEPGTERTHGPARQPTSCSSPAIPCRWTAPSVGR